MPHKRHPNTLKRVDIDSKNQYTDYRRVFGYDERDLRAANGRVEELQARIKNGEYAAYPERLAKWLGDVIAEKDRRKTYPRAEEKVHTAADYYYAHEAEFHDLAVIEAHLEGVPITVQQQQVIGELAVNQQVDAPEKA